MKTKFEPGEKAIFVEEGCIANILEVFYRHTGSEEEREPMYKIKIDRYKHTFNCRESFLAPLTELGKAIYE